MSGVLAIGDSITNACSRDLALGGVAAMSWAQRVAVAVGEPLTVHARPGAASAAIRRDLLPHVRGGYSLGLVYVGVNNVTSWSVWRRGNLSDDLAAIVERIAAVADRVLVMGYPSTLGRTVAPWPYGPGLPRRVRAGNSIVTEVAANAGACSVTCPDLRGHEVWVDGVHPTSLGHYAMARAALDSLGESPLPALEVAPISREYLMWRFREAVRFAVTAPPRGIGKWLVSAPLQDRDGLIRPYL